METDLRLKRLGQFEMPGIEAISAAHVQEGVFCPPEHPPLEALPPFYRVLLRMRADDGGLSYAEVWLPDGWNGVLLSLGNGGMAGKIAYGAFPEFLREGYAAANTDLGTSRGEESGVRRPGVWKDFGWRATHRMTEAAKALIRLHYGRAADFSYFYGASTGGQQALAEAQRFPGDYDGIFAEVPANNRTLLHTYFLWNHVHLRRPDGRVLFTQEEIGQITGLMTEFFQHKGDGCPGDPFISLPQAGDALLEEAVAWLSRSASFTEEQLRALRAVYGGPVNPRTGERIYNGMPAGSEIYSCGIADCQGERSPHFYPFLWAFGKDSSPYAFDFDRDLERLNDALAADLNANDPDLTAFRAGGGKLLIVSGSADPCVPFPDAMRYYERVLGRMGGYEAAGDFCRFFLMPGRDHGASGRGANALRGTDGASPLAVLRNWRENGAAPDSMRALRLLPGGGEGSAFSREIYPYGSPSFPLGCCPPACCGRYLEGWPPIASKEELS